MVINSANTSHGYQQFQIGIHQIAVAPKSPFLNNLLFAHGISLLEKYLYDVFIGEISHQPVLLQKLANTNKFKEQRLQVAFALNHDVGTWMINSMKSIVFHRLNDVQLYYRDVLNVSFEIERPLLDAIKKRHDVIHRNSHDVYGNAVTTTNAELNQLLGLLEVFVAKIDRKYMEQASVGSLPLS